MHSSAQPSIFEPYPQRTGFAVTLPDLAAGVTGLLLLGGLLMTQMPKHWQTTRGWLLVSLAGIPLFCMALAIMVKVPMLLFGVMGWACFHAGRNPRFRR
ncbi:hypothetical protein IB234_15365 [Pseudomonas sp. PDM16]|uniref:hypothetical protein n=1 Tax=Pseudomonas sp. PDM16 TaxID=2769292 RepID=UPI0017862766|nr:hypothetical protein [Pseudomonas sp. PDM16]MBD9415941.1 hypothetical protein [Pseudomonas sp. PDM16]